MENIYDVICWGRVVTNGEIFYLLSPRPYHSEMDDDKVKHSIWQLEGSLKWEVADAGGGEFVDKDIVYERSIIIFGQNALLEFYQDPTTIKVKYITPDDQEDVLEYSIQ